jgi:hypothetical protein
LQINIIVSSFDILPHHCLLLYLMNDVLSTVGYIAANRLRAANAELEIVRKEVVVVYFKIV